MSGGAAIYLRISDDREGRELGVTRQREDCTRIADRLGVPVVEVFTDNDIGASTRTRKGKRRADYLRMIRDAHGGRFDTIIAYTSSRITRRPREWEDLIELAEQRGVRFAYVASPEFDLNTSAGRMMARMMAAKDAGEAEDISERTRRAMRQLAEAGEPNGGRRAFGYTADGRELVEAEAAAVRKAYASLLAGRTLTGIAGDLNAAGHTTTVGGPWKHNSVRLMLRNARYAGIREYQGRRFPAAWPAVVGEDTWQAACVLLANPGRRTNGVGGARKWLGTGLYRCGRCEDDVAMICTYRQSGVRVYRCPVCKLSRQADKVDAFVTAVVAARLRQDPGLPGVLGSTRASEAADWRTEAMALRTRRAEAKTLFDEGVIDAGELRETRARIDTRLADLESKLADAGRGNAAASVLAAADPVAAWEATAGQVDRRQAIVDALMSSVRLLPSPPGVRTFDPDTVVITWREDL
jgi:DNA invertase Pin-like site-specific DNA recombinase